jgi:hypothetical protein
MPSYDQNNLSQLNFKFKLDRTPEIEYRAQTVTFPGMTLGTATVPTPFVAIPMPGNLTYDELTLSFLVGENMKDYLSIFDWMVALGHPDNLEQYRDWRSDCTLFILNSNLSPSVQVRFTDAYPVSLTGVEFDTTLSETQYATASVSFRFTRWYIEPIL